WQTEFGREHDRTGLVSEANIFRYRPLLDVLRIRVGAGYQLRDVLRQQLAALITGTEIRISAPAEIAAELPVNVTVQSAAEFAEEVANAESARIRALGEVEPEVYEAAVKSNSVVLAQPVLADGRRELLPYLLEQAVTALMHRFGIIRSVAGIKREALRRVCAPVHAENLPVHLPLRRCVYLCLQA